MSHTPHDLTGKPQELTGLIAVQPGAVVSRTLVSKPVGTVTLFAFDTDEGLSEHTAPYDALVQMIEGEMDIRIATDPHVVAAGQLLLLPANVPHALHARVPSKMLLTMIRA
ncbi:MAG: cupin domain-containing protein [Pseudomonadota bacterium]|jgi:quercetin dioxygenase-like cupin family protein